MEEDTQIKKLQEELRTLVLGKREPPVATPKVTLDWKHAQLLQVPQLTSPLLLKAAIDFQKQCIAQKAPCFHSFFVTQWIIANPQQVEVLEKESGEIRTGGSKLQSIRNYIKMRQHLIGKVNQFSGNYLKVLFEDIDDIRFLNFEIISLIQEWKGQWRTPKSEPVFYWGTINYLLKMGNDNADLINLANFKKTKFISPPNPFFLSQDGNLASMPQTQKEQIDRSITLIHKERTVDLRLAVEGAPFVLSSRDRQSLQAKSLKKGPSPKDKSFTAEAQKQLQLKKEDQIRNIYSIKSSLSSSRLRAHKESQFAQTRRQSKEQREQNQPLLKPSQPRDKQDTVRSKFSVYSSHKKPKETAKQESIKRVINKKQEAEKEPSPVQKVSQKEINNNPSPNRPKSKGGSEKLRLTINKALSSREEPRKVKQLKPKMRLIEEKESFTEQVAQNIFSLVQPDATKPVDKRGSTFYKTIEPILEDEKDEGRKGTQEKRYPQSLQKSPVRKTSQTQIDFNLRRKKVSLEKPEQKSQKELMKSSIKQLEKEEVAHKSSLKNLTIINIYGKTKLRPKQKTLQSQILEAEKTEPDQIPPKHQSSSFITEVFQKERPPKKNDLSQVVVQEKRKSHQKISRLESELESKSSIVEKEIQKLKQKKAGTSKAEEKLQEKNKAIQELQGKIKAIEISKKAESKRRPPQNSNKTFERQKKKAEIEAKIMRDHIKKEEDRMARNQQNDLKLKEQQLERELRQTIQLIEHDHRQKIQEYQSRLLLEQRKLKQTEQLMKAEKNSQKTLELQLAQQELKEKLLRRILEEKEKKQKQQEEAGLLTEEQANQQLQLELAEKRKMEEEALSLIEQEKLKMQKIYDQLTQKNEQMQKENDEKTQLINNLAHQRDIEAQKLRQMESQIQASFVREEVQPQDKEKEGQAINSEQELTELKQKIREEVMADMLRRQQQQEQEIEKEEERKRERLKRIQEEIASALKQEELKIEKENQEFFARLQSLKKKNQLQILPQAIQNLEENPPELKQVRTPEQSKVNIAVQFSSSSYPHPNSEGKEPFKEHFQPDYLLTVKSEKHEETEKEPGAEQNPHAKSFSEAQHLQEHKPEVTLQKESRNQVEEGEKVQQNKEEQKKEEEKQKEDPKMDEASRGAKEEKQKDEEVAPEINVQPLTHQQSPSKQEPAPSNQELTDPKHIPNKMGEEKPKKKLEVDPIEQADILEKYKALGKVLRKSRQIVLEDNNLSVFLESFLSNVDKTTRSMYPWGKEELEKMLLQKKGDVFDCSAMGWLEEKGKYMLVGSLECIQAIGSKYGAVQVHQLFLFDKSSSYQKQVLAKKIKDFQRIGFVFQKKASDNLFSIRFVIKIPQEIAGPPRAFGPSLSSSLSAQGHTQNEGQVKETHGFSYIFSRFIKEQHTSTELEQILSSHQHFTQAAKFQLIKGILPPTKGVQVTEAAGSIGLSLDWPLRYFRQKSRMFYLLSCSQYLVEENHCYVAHLSKQMCLVLQQHKQSSLPLDFASFESIDRLEKGRRLREIDVVLPVWHYSTTSLLRDHEQTYNFRERLTPRLIVGSVVSTFLLKHSYIELAPPFLVLGCQAREGKPFRPFHSHLVTPDQLTPALE